MKTSTFLFGITFILSASLVQKWPVSAARYQVVDIVPEQDDINPITDRGHTENLNTKWPLKVSSSGRYLTGADGKPFFYMCNTAWLLLSHTNYDEMRQYMDNLAKQKFTVVHFPILPLTSVDRESNATQLINPDPVLFDKCRDYMEYALSRNLAVNLIPVWQRSWQKALRSMSKQQIIDFSRYVGNTFQDMDNVIYSLGGDWFPKDQKDIDIVDWMAQGIEETSPDRLITFFCYGKKGGSELFHNRAWNDFNFIQVKGMAETDTALINPQYYTLVIGDYRKSPAKPTHLGETSYEYEYTGQIWPRVDSRIIRQTAYQSILSGGMGYTYGRRGLWHFNLPDNAMGYKLHKPWEDLLECSFSPGSCHMTHLVELFHHYPWHLLVPSHSREFATLGADQGSVDFTASAVASDSSFAMAYFPKIKSTTFDLKFFSGDMVMATWFDPTTGKTQSVPGSPFMKNYVELTPPGLNSAGHDDWVLIFESRILE